MKLSARIMVQFTALLAAIVPLRAPGAATLWNFENPADRLAASSGPGKLSYYDPDASGWGPAQTVFGKASSFGLPALPGGDADVMGFPACTARQGYRVVHGGGANGPYGDTHARVSNYTLIFDVLFPGSSDGRWRSLYQTDTNNANDGEFYVHNSVAGGIGTIGVYNGSIRSNTWHRIGIVMRSAPGEGACQRFIDGRFVGGIGSSGSALDLRWALAEAFLLLTDDNGETAAGYLSSLYFVDRPLAMEEIQALGGAHAAGATIPGPAAPPLTQQMSRRVGVIGHRGGFFCCAPDNTMAAVRRAISNNVPVIEIDTRLSADGVGVLVHDSTVDRTTDGTGAVSSLTVAQLKQLDAGSWFAPEFAGERVPTFAEVMAEAKGKLILYFDLKTPGQINAITNALAQTGFDPDDCWFWVYNNASDAASIRARLPNAKIIWEAGSNWDTPSFFPSMRSMGVYAFDQGVYYGTVSSAFVRAAKAEGFLVSIYTILDPDTMVRNAALGVDFMETDFPQIMQQIQPPQAAAATGPNPANSALNVAQNPTLTWIVGSNATAHRIYFGTNSNPPFLRQQSYDIVPLTNLSSGTTYYWRVDEVVGGGAITGEVWSFTVSGAPSVQTYEWTFNEPDLSATLGAGTLAFADNETATVTLFDTTAGSPVPPIAGQHAWFVHVPRLTNAGNGLILTFAASGPNGGGAYLNQFTLIMDVMIPAPLDWTALFNTNPSNANDADWYVAPDGRLGIAELGYAPAGTISANVWHRIAFVADFAAGFAAYYRNGTVVFTAPVGSYRDGRFSLYSNNDPGPDLLLFNEGVASGIFTHALYVNSIAFVDRRLSAAEIAALGGPRAEGIFVNSLRVGRGETGVSLNWQGASNLRLQRAATLAPPDWSDVPGTLGASNHTESVASGQNFFRLLRE